MPGQEGAENVGPGSAMSAWPGPRGLTWADREKLNRPHSASPPPYRCRWVEQRSSSLPAGAEELAAQKREQRLRKFRELHLKRVSCPGGHLTLVTWHRLQVHLWREEEGAPVRVTGRQSWMKVLTSVVLSLAALESLLKRTYFLQTFFEFGAGVPY